jgi:hypothetical protein
MVEQYSLPDMLARMYENQLAIEAALMELVLLRVISGLRKCTRGTSKNW